MSRQSSFMCFMATLVLLTFMFTGSASANEGWIHYIPAGEITALDVHGDTVWFGMGGKIIALDRHTRETWEWEVFPHINDIEIDGNGVVWASSKENGIVRFDSDLQNWRAVGDSLLSGRLCDIEIDSENNVYILGNNAISPSDYSHDIVYIQFLQRFDGDRWQTELLTRRMYDFETFCIDEVHDTFYISNFESVLTLSRETGDVRYYPAYTVYDTQDFAMSEDGIVYAANNDGVYVNTGDTFEKLPEVNETVNTLFIDSDGAFLLGTPGGLVRQKQNEIVRYTVDSGLLTDNIQYIAEDEDGALWIATPGGLQSFQNGTFTTAFHKGDIPAFGITGISISADNTLYASGSGIGGMVRYNGVTWKTLKPYDQHQYNIHSDDSIIARRGDTTVYWNGSEWQTVDAPAGAVFCHDTAGTPWIVSSAQGALTIHTIRDGEWISFPCENEHCLNLIGCGDSKGNLYFRSSTSSLIRYSSATDEYDEIDFSGMNYIVDMDVDDNDTVWTLCGINNHGIISNRSLVAYAMDGSVQYYPLKEAEEERSKGPAHSFTENFRGMICDHNGGVWLALYYEGLYRFKNGTWRHYSVESGDLLSNTIYDIDVGPDGRLWVASNAGLSVLDIETKVETTSENIPKANVLMSNFPNPFNPATTITFTLEKPEHAALSVYNVNGQCVKMLADNDFTAGIHRIVWNGTDDSGFPVAAGVYLTRLKYGDRAIVEKMTLVK